MIFLIKLGNQFYGQSIRSKNINQFSLILLHLLKLENVNLIGRGVANSKEVWLVNYSKFSIRSKQTA